MKYRRVGNRIERIEKVAGKNRWVAYVFWMKGSWCKLSADKIGQKEYDPVLSDEQTKLDAIEPGKEVEL